MQRRDFMSGAAGLVVGAGATYAVMRNKAPETPAPTAPAATAPQQPAAPAVAKGIRELKMVTSWPKNFPGLGTAAVRVADRISAMTEGKFRITVYGGGEIVPPLKCMDAVQEGTADLYHSADYYYQGKSKAFNYFTAVPLGLTADEINAWIRHGGGQALWDELSAQFGVKPLLCGNTGVQMGGWFTKELTSVEDFKGLKMRMPGLGGAVIAKLGGTTVTLPASDIFQALQSGTIDATEWVGPWNDLALGLYKVAKFYYYPGFHEPGSALSFGVSLRLWESLSVSEKASFTAAAGAVNGISLAEFDAYNA
ncbi:MAG: TRAP transporter substrate-binding protein, partial [Alphaproteobacteria bacterium]